MAALHRGLVRVQGGASYNSDGTVERTFGTDGRVTTDFPGMAASISSVVIQPGDSTADKTVNSADSRLTKGQVGLPVTAPNFRSDVDANGTINNADVRLVKSAFGHTLP